MAVVRGMLVGRPAAPFSSFFTHSSPKLALPIESTSTAETAVKFSGISATLPVGGTARSKGHLKDSKFQRNSSNLGRFVNFSDSSSSSGPVLGLQGRGRGFFSMAAAASETLSPADEAEYKIQEQILAHQKAAARLSQLEEARTLVHQAPLGTLSTISQKYDGYPVGSMVTHATDDDGSIVLSISSLSPHTKDLEVNPQCSLLVPKDPTDKSETIVTIIGEATTVSDQDEASARAAYLKKHPGAIWVDFGDFRFVRIQPRKVKYMSGIGTGFAALRDFTGEQYQAASVDPISQFGPAIAGHMNRDHSDQTAQIVEYSLGVKVDSALIQDVDKFGFGVLAKRQGRPVKLRIPFPRPAEDRKAVKSLIIEMLTPADS
ncbi:unnamed protein product [Calypogeia fissa]